MKSFWKDLNVISYVVGFFGGIVLLMWIPWNVRLNGNWESDEQLLTMSFRFVCVACMLFQLHQLHQLRVSLRFFKGRNLMNEKDEKIEELKEEIKKLKENK